MNFKENFSFSGFFIMLGLIVAAFVLAFGFKNLKQSGTITVKGVAETTVESDIAAWSPGYSKWYPNYAEAVKNTPANQNVLLYFLKNNGFTDEEIKPSEYKITNYLEEYQDEKGIWRSKTNGVTLAQDFEITTKDFTKLAKAYKALQLFIAEQGQINNRDPQYYVGNLDEIKQSMISKATEDARLRAEQFIKQGNGSLGTILSASQGSFNIYSDSLSSNDNEDHYGGVYDKSSIKKRVRLVVTVSYAIK